MVAAAIIMFISGVAGSIILGIKKKPVWMALCIIVSTVALFILLATAILLNAID